MLVSAMVVAPSLAQEPETTDIPDVEEVTATPAEPVEPVEPAEATEPTEPAEPARPKSLDGDTVNVMNRVEVIETSDQTRVTLGKNEVVIVEENGDTVVVALGSKGISIVEGDDSVQINIFEMDEREEPCETNHKKRFQGHWAGLEVGLNNYVTPDLSLVLPPGQEFMDLNTGKSWDWNLNIADFGVGLGSDYVGLVSGLGFEFINYNFDGQSSIMKDPGTGEIVEYVPEFVGFITKSKMNIAYMTAPLLLEFQIPTGAGRIYISGGVIGSLKLWSNTKIKYTESGDKSKEKNKSDFNLSPLRWGVTTRVGFKNVGLFANYYMTSLFKPGMGPELYPFAVGLALSFD